MVEVPRWLKLQEEISYWHFVLGQMLEKVQGRSGIARMIDEATGYDKEQIKEAEEIMQKIRDLKTEYEQLVGLTDTKEQT